MGRLRPQPQAGRSVGRVGHRSGGSGQGLTNIAEGLQASPGLQRPFCHPQGETPGPPSFASIRIKFPSLWDSGEPVGDSHTSLPSSLELTVCAGDTDINQMSQN